MIDFKSKLNNIFEIIFFILDIFVCFAYAMFYSACAFKKDWRGENSDIEDRKTIIYFRLGISNFKKIYLEIKNLFGLVSLG